jgi:hypothetical protein
MSGQLHAPVALLSWKDLPVPIGFVEPRCNPERGGEEKKSVSLPGNDPRWTRL